LENVGPLIQKAISGPAKLDRMEIIGPASEIAKTKEIAAPLSPVFFESDDQEKNLVTENTTAIENSETSENEEL